VACSGALRGPRPFGHVRLDAKRLKTCGGDATRADRPPEFATRFLARSLFLIGNPPHGDIPPRSLGPHNQETWEAVCFASSRENHHDRMIASEALGLALIGMAHLRAAQRIN